MRKRKVRVGRPAKQLVQALGDHVVAVADGLFIARGYSATSMAIVAARARVSKQTLYHRYPNKASLFREVIGRRMEALLVPDNEEREGGGPLVELKQLGRRALDTVLEAEFVQLFRIIIAESAAFPELATTAAAYWDSGFIERCTAAVARAQSAGICRAGNPNAIAQCFLWSLVGEPFNKALAAEWTMKRDAQRRTHLELVWSVFIEGVSGGPLY
jgi:AcrR family transcriptional regulator